ncbi:MAG: FHIPEP family type III secretion protein, partial [Pseudomonadota bacterium]
KFIKGVAIAGSLITVINLVGGVAVGTLQMGMSVGESLTLFAILTVGDGLVAQIPALLIALSAGMVVTRQPSGANGNLGADIARQLGSQPRALLTGAALLLLFALVPGFPAATLALLALLLGVVGWLLLRHAATTVASAPVAALSAPDFTQCVELALACDLVAMEADDDFVDTVGALPRVVGEELGIHLPAIAIVADDGLPAGTFAVRVQGAEVDTGVALAGRLLVDGPQRRLERCAATLTAHPADAASLWARGSDRDELVQAGLRCHSATDIVVLRLSHSLRRYGAQFVGIQETRNLLDSICLSHPELVREVLRCAPLPQLAQVFKRLVAEQVSLRDLRAVLEAVVQFGPVEQDPVLLAEYVRTHLKQALLPGRLDTEKRLPAIVLGSAVESVLRQSVRKSAAGSYLDIAPQQARYIVDNVREALALANGRSPSLVTAMDIRPFVQKLLAAEVCDLPVLSFQELGAGIHVERLAEIQ